MLPTDTLKKEHEIVLSVMDSMEKEIANLSQENNINVDKIEKFVDFTKNFTDGCHHAKEEKHLFAKMKEKGMSFESGPIAVMLHEHEMARAYIKGIVDNLKQAGNGDIPSINAVTQNITNYIYLLRNHIAKENNILFNMADNLFSGDEQLELEKIFEKVDKEEIGEDVHKFYHLLAQELSGG